MSSEAASLDGWDITRNADVDWAPWGADGKAQVKILGQADGYMVALVEAQAGYRSSHHDHAHTEFFYLVDGRIRTQGQELGAGDGYAAAAGSAHDDFEVLSPSKYLSIFRL